MQMNKKIQLKIIFITKIPTVINQTVSATKDHLIFPGTALKAIIVMVSRLQKILNILKTVQNILQPQLLITMNRRSQQQLLRIQKSQNQHLVKLMDMKLVIQILISLQLTTISQLITK
jgi:hypothetical protein